ncbi:UNVERIFIED_CONTAM: hypothetical protein RMT77_016192 [Armadillidium vulgare]
MVRVKRRYFVLQVKYPERPNHHAKYDNSLKKAVLKAVEKLYGEFGMAAFTNSYQFKYSNKETGVYYVRVDRNVEPLLKTCLPSITAIENERVSITTLHVAATLRHGHIFLKKYNQNLISKNKDPKSKLQLNKKEKIILKRKKRVQRR